MATFLHLLALPFFLEAILWCTGMYLYCVLLHHDRHPATLFSPCLALIGFQDTLLAYLALLLQATFVSVLILTVAHTIHKWNTSRRKTDQAHVCLRECAHRLNITGQKHEELNKVVGELSDAVKSKVDGRDNAHAH